MRTVLFDPYQMQSTAQRLAKAGVPVEEFPQSSPNLTAASQNLFELISSQSIIAYPDEQIRLAISRCVAIETPRGWRIGKDRTSFKIDVVVALAMACHAAVKGQGASNFDRTWAWYDGNPIQQTATNKTDAGRKQRESDENFRWRLANYMRSIGAGW